MAIIKTYFLKVINFLKKIPQQIRITFLNFQRGISISHDIILDPSVRISLNPDGYRTGGKVTIARGTRISNNVIIAPFGGTIEIQENVYIGPYCILYGHGGLSIGRDTLIAAQTIIIPANHQFNDLSKLISRQGIDKKGISIGENVWVGAGVKILDGVIIGDGAVIGAGSVVTKSVDEMSVVAGIPARTIKRRN